MKDLKLKLLEESIGETLQDIDTGKDFLNNSLIVQEIRARLTNGIASN
jgi:hypothetical protein